MTLMKTALPTIWSPQVKPPSPIERDEDISSPSMTFRTTAQKSSRCSNLSTS